MFPGWNGVHVSLKQNFGPWITGLQLPDNVEAVRLDFLPFDLGESHLLHQVLEVATHFELLAEDARDPDRFLDCLDRSMRVDGFNDLLTPISRQKMRLQIVETSSVVRFRQRSRKSRDHALYSSELIASRTLARGSISYIDV